MNIAVAQCQLEQLVSVVKCFFFVASMFFLFSIEVSQALCLIVHAADVSHPTKLWKTHFP